MHQSINMIIMVIQFPRVTLSYFNLLQLAISLSLQIPMSPTFHIILSKCKFKVRQSVKAINGTVSMD